MAATLQRSNIANLSKVANGYECDKDKEHEYYLLMVREDRDTALLSLLRSFLESGPQLVLQIYIFAKRNHLEASFLDWVQVAAIWSSLFELSWSLASYQRALRRSVPEKRNMTMMGSVLQFTWRLLTISSRALALALFASQFGYWLLPVAIGHWGVMTVWVMHQGTRFCDTDRGEPRPCEEYLFNMVIGAIYLLCFLNVKDEPTRYKYAAYYVIAFLENASLITLWYFKTTSPGLSGSAAVIPQLQLWWSAAALTSVLATFCGGVLVLLLYYRFAHPNGKPLWVNRAARCC